MNMTLTVLAHVNDVPLVSAGEVVEPEALRQRACAELLRQAAIRQGLLPSDDPVPEGGVMTAAASDAIEALLDGELHLPEPSHQACLRHYQAYPARYAVGERLRARHILFAVTPGVDIAALRTRAEACLLDLRAASEGGPDRFPEVAAQTSNCPSGQAGGELGWLQADDCAPEFAREVFGHAGVGVLPRLVHSRFGLHVVEVLAREPGVLPTFETVMPAVAQSLRQQAVATALRQYLQLLAGQARVEGVDLEAADTPLVQ